MESTPETIVAKLPPELRVPDLAAVLGVTVIHLDRMRSENRVPKEDYRLRGNVGTPVWKLESIRAWLIARLVNREAEVAAAQKAFKAARAARGHAPSKAVKPPLFPFLGIY